jgi:hypothetical protein
MFSNCRQKILMNGTHGIGWPFRTAESQAFCLYLIQWNVGRRMVGRKEEGSKVAGHLILLAHTSYGENGQEG